jgi:hypothetical protein
MAIDSAILAQILETLQIQSVEMKRLADVGTNAKDRITHLGGEVSKTQV